MKRQLRMPILLVLCYSLSGCAAALIGAAVQLGGSAVIAGVEAVQGANDPEVAAYCWDPEKQSASTSTTANCWAPEVNITEDEYEKFRESGVRPASAPAPSTPVIAASTKQDDWSIHCFDPK